MNRIVVANWKMNGLRAEGLRLAAALAEKAAELPATRQVVLCPPATLLYEVGKLLAGPAIALGGQDCHPEAAGAFTGDISAGMLKDAGCAYVIVGHSERRQGHGEDNLLICRKATAAHQAGLVPVVCVGETLAEREAGKTLAILEGQVTHSLPEDGRCLVAYEPVWAIGTGKIPTPEQIAEAHMAIRQAAARRLGCAGTEVAVLYGGSVKSANAGEIMAIPGVDGVLVGGASLNAEEFWKIVIS